MGPAVCIEAAVVAPVKLRFEYMLNPAKAVTPSPIAPLVKILLPVIFPVVLNEVPVITPPTTDAAVVVPVTLVEVPVITPPTVLAAVCVPVTLEFVPK